MLEIILDLQDRRKLNCVLSKKDDSAGVARQSAQGFVV